MNIAGRPQSDNVIDLRSYFGTEALDPDYWDEDRYADFLKFALMNPNMMAPAQQFAPKKKPRPTDSIFQNLPSP